MRLADIQANFSRALLDTNNRFEVEFHCGIVSDQFRAADRMQIYKNNVLFSLVDVLAACYPLTRDIIGEEAFEQLAKMTVRQFPPLQADTTQYGADFGRCVAGVKSVVEPVPYLLEIIRFEWLCDRLQYQPAPIPKHRIPIAEFGLYSASEQQAAKLHLTPRLALFASDWAVLDIRNAVLSNEFAQLDLQKPQRVVLCSIEEQLSFDDIQPETFQLLQLMQQAIAINELTDTQLHLLPELIAKHWITHFSL